MSDQLLVVLRVCLLVLVYLVFLRVLRAVWVELRAPTAVDTPARPRQSAPTPGPRPATAPTVPAGAGRTTTATATRLRVVDPPSWSGQTYALDGECTIGRAAGCRIALDDDRVSKLHARVFERDGRWFIEDLGSTNGTEVNGQRVGKAVPVAVGDQVRVGAIILELA